MIFVDDAKTSSSNVPGNGFGMTGGNGLDIIGGGGGTITELEGMDEDFDPGNRFANEDDPPLLNVVFSSGNCFEYDDILFVVVCKLLLDDRTSSGDVLAYPTGFAGDVATVGRSADVTSGFVKFGLTDGGVFDWLVFFSINAVIIICLHKF